MKVFGPVLVVLTFRTAKEAIALANNTVYGLASSVWTENIGLAMEVARCIRAGCVWINGHNMFDASAGFGGMRQSGFGRDGGKEVQVSWVGGGTIFKFIFSLKRSLSILKGLYEYVKPSWQNRVRTKIANYDIKKFGSTSPPRPKNPCINPAIHSAVDDDIPWY